MENKLNLDEIEKLPAKERALLKKRHALHCKYGKHTIFRLDAHYSQPYLCAVTFNNNDYGKRKSKLSGGI